MLISSTEPLREVSLDNIKLPLSFLTRFSKNHFELILTTDQLTRIAPDLTNYVLKIVNLAGQSSYVTLSAHDNKRLKVTSKALSFYGVPCKQACIRVYAGIVKDLVANLTVPIIDASNQQKVFNESILCDATVITDCDNGLTTSDSNDISFQALENQWVVEFRGLEQHQSWFTGELLVARYSVLTQETLLLTSIFVREKSEDRLINILAEKTRTLIQLNL